MIPDEAVEAAAKVIHDSFRVSRWEDRGPWAKQTYYDIARAALEAALPHLRNELKPERN